MKKHTSIAIFALLFLFTFFSSGRISSYDMKDIEKLEGITHYGMPIEEITKTYHKDDGTLLIVYSKTLSDDNMDDYVKRFYDEMLRRIELWLYSNRLPARNMKIVISNCKFCKIGYCKRKNIREVRLASYASDKPFKQVSILHSDIIDGSKYAVISGSVVIDLLEK